VPKLKTVIESIIKDGLLANIFDRNELAVAQNSVYYRHVNFDVFNLLSAKYVSGEGFGRTLTKPITYFSSFQIVYRVFVQF
jgi:hypothetical protein